jgi:hypothetical protein
MRLIFADTAWDDYLYWQAHDKRLLGTSKNPCHLGRSGKIEGLPSLPEQSR